MYYKNSIHKQIFLAWLNEQQSKCSMKEVLVYLLSSDRQLWCEINHCGFDFGEFCESIKTKKSKNLQYNYTILKAAEDLFQAGSNSHISISDLACRDVVDKTSFDLILQAILLSRYDAENCD